MTAFLAGKYFHLIGCFRKAGSAYLVSNRFDLCFTIGLSLLDSIDTAVNRYGLIIFYQIDFLKYNFKKFYLKYARESVIIKGIIGYEQEFMLSITERMPYDTKTRR